MTVESLLRTMRETGSLTQVLMASERLSDAARDEPTSVDALTAAIEGEDQAVAIAALHAVAHIEHDGPDPHGAAAAADAVLAEALTEVRRIWLCTGGLRFGGGDVFVLSTGRQGDGCQ